MKKLVLFSVLLSFTAMLLAQIPAFPGAEGFGALATTGGRGGSVYYVTNLNCSGPGSLNYALNQPGRKYILFTVSGVIDCAAEVTWGDCYIAGQTSPGGITVRGILLDDFYEPAGSARNVIIRHLNSRPGRTEARPGQGWVLDDALRLDGARSVVVDHCSLANAVDECVQLSRSSQITISNCMLAETLGGHYEYGGMLINYSTADYPKDSITVHHNLWNRIGGRMPEISCEESGERPGDQTCITRPFRFEYSNNLLWDIPIQVYYDRGFNSSNSAYHDLVANFVGNHAVGRSSYCGPLFNVALLQNPDNQFFTSGNSMASLPAYTDYQLFSCCNDFCQYAPNTQSGSAVIRNQRHGFPNITYTSSLQLRDYMIQQAGAFNSYSSGHRDPMNRRLLNPLRNNTPDTQPVNGTDFYNDAYVLDFSSPPPSPLDTDQDGMPDAWETAHGLNPSTQDHNQTNLSVAMTGIDGYTNLECYLNELSSLLINQTAGTITGLNCAAAQHNGLLSPGAAASNVLTQVPYTGGNGGTFSGQVIPSSGVSGLTATLSAGSFAVGSGSLSYALSGTPSAAGVASFAISVGGQSCTFTRNVSAASAFPTVLTTAVSQIKASSASSGGDIPQGGGSPITARGVVWSTTENPTIALATKTSNGTGTGVFTASLSGLNGGTTYYLRAYATNSAGTAYGNQVSFTTGTVPVLSTKAISSITTTAARSGGAVTVQGSSPVTERGVVWSITSKPTIERSTKTSNGSGLGSFNSNLTGLSPNTTYYVRAYATNSAGTGYGAQRSFTTMGNAAPPIIQSMVPSAAASGSTVILFGTGFNNTSEVRFGNVPAQSFTLFDSETVLAVVGAGASGNVTLTTPGGTASLAGFSFLATAMPIIASFRPATAASGQTVLLRGTNFTHVRQVQFGTTNASSFTVIDPTAILAVVGNGSSGSVSVTTAGGTASQSGFTFLNGTNTSNLAPTPTPQTTAPKTENQWAAPGESTSPSLHVFPNPTAEGCTVQVNSPLPYAAGILRIMDTTGHEIRRMKQIGSGSVELDFSGQPKGMYLLILSDDQGRILDSKRIIHQ